MKINKKRQQRPIFLKKDNHFPNSIPILILGTKFDVPALPLKFIKLLQSIKESERYINKNKYLKKFN